jgi:hypothetical protein
MKRRCQSGVALITVMLILLLMSALLAGFAMLVMEDARMGGIDRDYRRSFYAAQAGMEKMTSDLGNLFSVNFSPSAAQVNAIEGIPPVLPGVTYVAPGGGNGYDISFPTDPLGNPQASIRTILSGPYQGFTGLITPYQMQITALTNGREVRVQRTVQTVAIPVFQFGIFSETDLSFFPGPVFNFGGRVHTNGNLFLASGNRVTFADRVTAVREVIRTHLANGVPSTVNHNGIVEGITSPGNFRALAVNEGSADIFGTLNPAWPNISISTYNGNIRNGLTGARLLQLPLVSAGAQPIDLIRLPEVNEDVNNPQLFSQRFFASNAGTSDITSLRILLADDGFEITSLPTVTALQPVFLGNPATEAAAPGIPAGCRTRAFNPPVAESTGAAAAGHWTTANHSLIRGCIKIEMNDVAGNWQDVTDEILNFGYISRNLNPAGGLPSTPANKRAPIVGGCNDPHPNAIIRFQHVKDAPASFAPCGVNSPNRTDYWPMVLYDTREGNLRDNIPVAQATVFLNGVMHYVELDITNLGRWLTGALAGSGINAVRGNNGYVVYFSDRRTNRVDPSPGVGRKIGEYGFEDFVNPASGAGTPNNFLDTGEDVNGDGNQQVYGITPDPAILGQLTGVAPAGGIVPNAGTRPWTLVTVNEARVNPPLFFRRALKLTRGTQLSLGACPSGANCGLTIAAENPVYVEGDYNAPGSSFAGVHAGAAVIGDAVTLLSRGWNDVNSFGAPHNAGNGPRAALTTWYRLAIVSGKGLNFPQPAGTATDFGTDGGTHNFLRYIEDWGGQTLNYRGSIVSFYNSVQAVGVYKCCTNVYSPPTRGYNFDIEFLQPNLLPPRTPLFRDINATGFSQVVLPSQ